jgi:RimJ/RimL family protein N-acetyltransferase
MIHAGSVLDMDSRTARLSLHAINELEARRIHDRAPQSGDAWAADYPFEGDLAAIGSFLRATEQNGEQRPFGYYQIRRQSDRLAIGGVGFKGPPDGGVVEIGYGLVPSARGHGYAREALGTLMQIAAGLGVTTIRADTDPDNVASQRTLEHAGFYQVEADSELCHYEARISQVQTS